MDRKKVAWKFDPSSSTIFVSKDEGAQADKEARFKFELVIYKDPESHIESMKITNYVVDKEAVAAGAWETTPGNENGAIVTSIVDLARDIKEFKKFGVVMGDTYFRELAKRIEDEYPNIKVSTVTLLKSDKRYNDLLDEIKRFFEESKRLKEKDDYITSDFCNIPVRQFNGLASDCGYSEYEMKDLRVQLDNDKYIYVVSGRYAVLKRISGKPERVIAFYRKKLGVALPVKPEKKATVKKSGADE